MNGRRMKEEKLVTSYIPVYTRRRSRPTNLDLRREWLKSRQRVDKVTCYGPNGHRYGMTTVRVGESSTGAFSIRLHIRGKQQP